MVKFVAPCEKCGETKILGEFGKCKACFAKWFTKTLNEPDYITDLDTWYPSNGSDPDPPIEPNIPYVPPAKCNHDSVQSNLDCPIIIDDSHGPQPDPAKIEAAVERMKALEPPATVTSRVWFSETNPDEWYVISDIGNDIVDELGPTKKAAELQDKLNQTQREILRKGIETNDLRYTGPYFKKI